MPKLQKTAARFPIPKRYRAIFQHTMSADLAQLEQALREEDNEVVQQLLHRMAGALVIMGIQEMADTMLLLKDQLRHNTDKQDTVHAQAMALCAALRDLLHHT